MSWIYLFLAGLGEIGWAVGMKYTEGFTRPIPSLVTVALMILSFGLLSLALRELPLSSSYAIWTGIGTVGTFLFGLLVLHEPVTALHGLCVVMIVAGIIGLRLLAN
ncbi:MAG: multidrug efflux SMR transporter [Anaerovibrio sp.]|uniref:DMT family transporter n=1 Tax=Anaerovibrio sp. TaxID=1872532 RepID=UPI0025FF1905|nr:multidrug efflux SMR transporter [Anaerovibrio sp.]MCR5176123.1 multidrug efflux SMR transporter [Anaerovibrio sp.]